MACGDDVRGELERLCRTGKGLLTAEAVVEAARNERSPLHGEFEWDDSAAAHRYRIEQARGLIRRFPIQYREVERETRTYEVRSAVPQFSPHPEPGDSQGYADTADLLAGPNRDPLLAAELRRWLGHTARLRGYLDMAELPAESKLLERVAAKLRAVLEPAACEAGK
jgi:hypothetical protein